MRAVVDVIAAALLLPLVTAQAGAKPTDITAMRESEFRHYVGRPVQIHGRFSLYGKFGAYVNTGQVVTYIVRNPSRSLTWDPKIYEPLEGKRVVVTGVLHFYRAPPFTGDSSIARPPDYFYFELVHSRIDKISTEH